MNKIRHFVIANVIHRLDEVFRIADYRSISRRRTWVYTDYATIGDIMSRMCDGPGTDELLTGMAITEDDVTSMRIPTHVEEVICGTRP